MKWAIRFTRREFVKLGVATMASLRLAPGTLIAAEQRSAGEPIQLSPGEQLFLDDYLIASQTGLRRVLNSPPVRLPNPIATKDDQNYQPYVSVLRDPETRRFRMWYGTCAGKGAKQLISYMESENGVDWIRPHRDLDIQAPMGFGCSVIDEGAKFGDSQRRYKMIWEHGGIMMATSPDGLKWTPVSQKEIYSGNEDITSLSWDPYRKHYLIIHKVGSRPEDGYKGSTPNAKEGTRRLVGQTTSTDCVNWAPPKCIIVADNKDEGIMEFYSVGNVIARGGLLIGLLKVLRDDLACEPDGEKQGIGYTVLVWSRDGENWERSREPFMDRNSTPHAWDRAMTWGDCLLPVDDEVFIYYGGYARGHKVERYAERQLGFAKMQRDRFVSRDADASGGSLRTPLLVLDGSDLTINANVSGELRVQVLNPQGAAISGFDLSDCTPIRGTALAHAVKWKQPFSALKGKPVQLEFALRDARLYGFELIG